MTRAVPSLFSGTVFLGSFLLFAVQPIIAKYIQPHFGSTSSVWNTCLMFFQGVLFLGYLYAHLLGQLKPRRQLMIHAGLLAALLVVGGYHLSRWGSPILPVLTATYSPNPSFTILTTLLVSIGLPFLLLSSNSTLVQHWFNYAEPRKNAYALYAISNTGSLLALLAYPFLFEPFVGLRAQSLGWFSLLILYGILILLCARTATQRRSQHALPTAQPDVAEPIRMDRPIRQVAHWFLLTMTGSMLLLAVTSELTQNVAPVPFLWIIPLAVYLLTFVLGFSRLFAVYRPTAVLLILAGAGLTLYALSNTLTLPIGAMIALLATALFCVCLYCHGTLYATRPDHQHLTFFYLIVSLGGFVGGFFVSIIAPLIFPAYWELHFALGLALLLAMFQLMTAKRPPLAVRCAGAAAALMLCFFLGKALVEQHGKAIFFDRNFYGTIRVEQEVRGEGEQAIRRTTLKHGDIVHGMQFSRTEYRHRPVAYFHENSGIGRAILHHPLRAIDGRSFHIGVVGGGIGTLVAYAREGDMVRLYELNPAVQQLAVNTEYFTYLLDYQGRWSAVIGDGRLSLAADLEEPDRPPFDVLAIDVFNGDAIPVHMLTREAIELYLRLIDQDHGVFAIHITNKHVDFLPLMRAIANEFALNAVVIQMPGDGIINQASRWAVFTKHAGLFSSRVFREGAVPLIDVRPTPLWTDDRSSLLPLLIFNP